LTTASWVVANQNVVASVPGNTAKSIVNVATAITGFSGIFLTLFGHSLGMDVPNESTDAPAKSGGES
jgi:hypothetical protein